MKPVLLGAAVTLSCIWAGYFSLFAQAALLDGHQNAFYAGASFSGSGVAKSIGAETGYTFRGLAHLGAVMRRVGYDELGIHGRSIAPRLGLRLLTPNERLPFGVILFAGYMLNSYPASEISSRRLRSLREGILGLKAAAFARMPLSPKVDLIPEVGVPFLAGSAKHEDFLGNTTTLNYNALGFELLAGLHYRISPSSLLLFSTGISIFENETALQASLSFGLGKFGSGVEAEPVELFSDEEETRIPNFRAAFPKFNRLSDEEILAAYRKKFPNLRKVSDDKLILMIEKKYRQRSSTK